MIHRIRMSSKKFYKTSFLRQNFIFAISFVVGIFFIDRVAFSGTIDSKMKINPVMNILTLYLSS